MIAHNQILGRYNLVNSSLRRFNFLNLWGVPLAVAQRAMKEIVPHARGASKIRQL
jgi:hypothetical protein